ncbi:hypothetical protein BD410DRAFT_335453 [Rickenella mellea]|uniref:Uncharacterized protein n=1 Tax=Rickenella mellea TaxID=50990 RepID=A0A4Y7QKF5_9AGAM|nr:hypothetical protein BD410DRAFT_335453 [Rickenella mellea]
MSLAEFYLPASTSRAVDVDVWDVSALSSLNASHVTWIGRPSRKRHLGSLSAAYGIVSTTAPFRCVQGFPFIIELSCSNPGCTLEYRMDDKEPKLGIELIPR